MPLANSLTHDRLGYKVMIQTCIIAAADTARCPFSSDKACRVSGRIPASSDRQPLSFLTEARMSKDSTDGSRIRKKSECMAVLLQHGRIFTNSASLAFTYRTHETPGCILLVLGETGVASSYRNTAILGSSYSKNLLRHQPHTPNFAI